MLHDSVIGVDLSISLSLKERVKYKLILEYITDIFI